MFDKLKQLSKDTAVYGLSTMIGRFLSFLLVPFYTNIFLPEEYGIITNIYAFIAILNIIFVYGMDAAYLRFAATMEVGDEKDNFSTPFLSVFVSGLFLSMFILVFQNPVLKTLAVPDHYSYLVYYIILILLFDTLAVIPFIKLRLERKSKKFSFYKIINILVNVILNIILIVYYRAGIEAVFISNLAASAAALLLVSGIIFKNLRLKINSALLKRLLKFGIPYLPAGLAASFIQVIDRPIMEHLTDLNNLGIYQANYKLGIFMMLFINMFQFAWQPFFLAEAKEEGAKEIFSKVFTYFTIAGSVILVVLSLFIDDIVKLEISGRSLIGPAFWSGLYIVPVVLLAYLFNGLHVIFSAGIFIKEKSVYVPVITGISALIDIAVNFILIPPMGIMGAALATLASYLFMALALFFVTQSFYKINYEYGKILKIFLSIIVTGSLYYYLLFNEQLTLFYKFLLLILFIISIAVFAVDKKEIAFIRKKILRRERIIND